MIKSVTTQEFDKDVLKVGSFITYCKTVKKFTNIFSNQFEIVNSHEVNGIISHVGIDYINIVNIGSGARITIDDILGDKKRILGVFENAMSVVTPEPEVIEPDVPEEGSITPPDESIVPEEGSITPPDESIVPEEGSTEQTPETP